MVRSARCIATSTKTGTPEPEWGLMFDGSVVASRKMVEKLP